MSIRYEERYGKAGYDIRFPKLRIRERCSFPEEVRTDVARKRYAERRAATLLTDGKPEPARTVATFAEFGPRWMKDYARAEGLKPSTLDTYERILRLHLCPTLGTVRLDAIGDLQVQRVKLHLERASAKTRHDVLGTLSNILSTAERWEEIIRAPHIQLPSIALPEMEFYDFEEWERLVGGAERAGPMVRAAILLGGDAGLRRGEIVALEQSDVGGGAVSVRRSEWEGHVGTPKGGKARRIPLTTRLEQAVKEVRHLRGKRLLWQPSGKPVKVTTLQSWMEVACRRAGLPPSRNLHKLRHTFCSHLAMRGAPARVIQELAGHADLKTTMRYMHLAKGSAEAAVALLEMPHRVGDSAGTANSGTRR